MEEFKVSRWGNSLAIRLPASVVKELDLKEGDLLTRDVLALRRPLPKMTREEAIQRLTARRWTLPPGYKFNREELYERDDDEG